VRAHEPVRAEARCPELKSFQIRPLTENAGGVLGDLRSAKQKSPTDPRGSFGLPSRAGPATSMVQRMLRKITHATV